ncbi:hypothetical protein CLU79DRAFT_696671, partial [Phycomyces nitens]
VLAAANITNLHDRQSAYAIRYLGFPLTSYPRQLKSFCSALLSKLDRHYLVLAQRRLWIPLNRNTEKQVTDYMNCYILESLLVQSVLLKDFELVIFYLTKFLPKQ